MSKEHKKQPAPAAPPKPAEGEPKAEQDDQARYKTQQFKKYVIGPSGRRRVVDGSN